MSGILMVALCSAVGQTSARDYQLAGLFEAIRLVETGGEPRPERAVGDGGRSLGPYQISREYLADSGVDGAWRRCRDRAFSEAVMLAYWKRHCPEALRKRDLETLARVHNGGPNGHNKSATARYWNLVRGNLRSAPFARKALSVQSSRGRMG